jgi:hypothetical protein
MSQVIAEVGNHKIRQGQDGVIYCDCWPWKKYRDCKHLAMMRVEKKRDERCFDLTKAIEQARRIISG